MNHDDGMGDCVCKKCNIVRNNISIDKWYHMTYKKVENIDDFFHEPKLRKHISAKPEGCIWFSAGSWLYDPYSDHSDCHDEKEENNINVISVTNPVNILKITNLQELINFNDQYKKGSLINWEKVKNNGYYGVSFTFRKCYYFKGYDWEKIGQSLDWQWGFDVESLCIFDLRAINGLLTYETVSI
jgi:hypothetical protein